MGQRQKEWARAKRNQLINLYGGACELCGEIHNLTFDVINPVRYGAHHRMDFSARTSFYAQQHARNNLQLLCRSCNSRKNDRRKPK